MRDATLAVVDRMVWSKGRVRRGCGRIVARSKEVAKALDWEVIFWAVLAALAFVGEVLSVSFFLLFFALGAVVGLLLAFAGVPVVGQVIGFVLASVLSMVVLRPALLNRLSLRNSERYVGRGGIEGRSAVVTNDIEPGETGMIKVGGEFWTAQAIHPDEKIKSGSKVRVLDTNGLTALVATLDEVEGD